MLVLTVGFGSWLLVGRVPSLPAAPLARVPKDASAAVWLDVGAAMEAPVLADVLAARGGVARIESLCGFDPLETVEDLVVFAGADAPASLAGLGWIARGELDHERLAECVGKVVEADGGEVRRVDIAGTPAVAAGGSSRAAFVGRDGVVGGDEGTVRSVLGVVKEGAPSLAEDGTLTRLWGRVSQGRHLVAAGRLPERWRTALARALGAGESGPLSALADVRAFGLGARLGHGVDLGVAVELPDGEGAAALVTALRQRIDGLLEDPMLALSPVGAILRGVELEAQGRDLAAAVSIDRDEVDALVELAHAVGRQDRADAEPPARALPAPAPDESLRAP